MSNPKARDVRARGGDDSPLMLIPELCTRTGEEGGRGRGRERGGGGGREGGRGRWGGGGGGM